MPQLALSISCALVKVISAYQVELSAGRRINTRGERSGMMGNSSYRQPRSFSLKSLSPEPVRVGRPGGMLDLILIRYLRKYIKGACVKCCVLFLSNYWLCPEHPQMALKILESAPTME